MRVTRFQNKRLLIVALGVFVLFGFGLAGNASASEKVVEQFSSEAVRSFDVVIEANKDGSIDVVEQIEYDFGSQRRHGIFRYIPVVFDWNGESPEGALEGSEFERVTPIRDISVSSSSGAPGQYEESDEEGTKVLKIGDPDRTITGVHTYTVSYTLEGVANAFDDYDEFYINIVGAGWDVPIELVNASVRLPAEPLRIACFTGPVNANANCESAEIVGDVVEVTQSNGAAYSAVTLVVGLEKGVLEDPADTMILREKWSIASAFRVTPATGLGGGTLLVGGLGLIGVLGWRRGRDRQFTGSATDVAFGNSTGDETRVPLFNDGATTVEFVPPEGIRPGHMGTLIDEVANHLDVSAMIIDLAVRGYLRIEEVETRGFRSSADYRLVKLRDIDSPPSGGVPLQSAERLLLSNLFKTSDSPLLSSLKTKFASSLAAVQDALYVDTVGAGWFPVRPDKVRKMWQGIGIVVTLIGAAIAFVVALSTHAGLVAAPLPIIGLAILVFSGRFPHRTGKGTAMLGRVKGFKEIFDAGEGERQDWSAHRNLFTEYLPYAIVFGCTEKWEKAFEGLQLSPQELGYGVWYTSPYGYRPYMMGRAMNDFTTTSIGSMAAAAPSSAGGSSSGLSGFSGGFSGGGFGGGGGGSW